jgi:hypothetical protein
MAPMFAEPVKRTTLAVLAAVLALVAVWAPAAAHAGVVDGLLSGQQCDPTDPAVCLQPFPNNFFTRTDAGTATALRVDFRRASMPRNVLGIAIDPTEWNRSDGFSPGSALITRVPGLDSDAALAKTGAVPIDDLDRYADASQPVVVLDTATGKRWPIWTEVDANPSDATQRNLIIRPAKNFTEGHRYIVALRRMRTADGTVIAPSTAFKDYRDKLATADPSIEARRAHFEDLFASLAKAGVGRADLFLTWDFTVASRPSLSSRMLTMRDDAFGQLGDANLADGKVTGSSPAFTVDSVVNDPDGADAPVLRRIKGRVTVPCYLNALGCPSGARLNYASGTDSPRQLSGNTFQAKFQCEVPRAAAAGVALRPTLYGHGLLGDRAEVSQSQNETMANTYGYLYCSTDWIGMACTDMPSLDTGYLGNLVTQILAGAAPYTPDCDVPQVVTDFLDVSNFPSLPDRAQQGMLNFLYLGRALVSPKGLGTNAAFQLNGKSLIDTTKLYYDGNSQGGIMGGALMAISPDAERGVLGVPGMNYSLLLRRSADFSTYATILYNAYPDELERPLLLQIMQMLWDRSEADGYAQHITTDPLPNTPKHEILMQAGLGDHQVSQYAAEVEARTIGASARTPWADPGRMAAKSPLFGLPAIASYPFAGSAITLWDIGPVRDENGSTVGTAVPPKTEIAPSIGQDPHDLVRESPLSIAQRSAFLKPAGRVVNPCGAHPCYAGTWTGP